MTNFHSPYGAFAEVDLGAASSSRRKAPVSDSMLNALLKKFPWLRDDSARLKREFDSDEPRSAKTLFRKLARLRDHYRKVAKNAAGAHPAERATASLLTLGVSELARALFKKPLKQAKKDYILKLLAKADACDILLRYWAGKFRERAKFNKANKRMVEAYMEAEKLLQDGVTEGKSAQPGDEDIEEAAEQAEDSDPSDNSLGFMGLSGGEMIACGVLGALAGFALS